MLYDFFFFLSREGVLTFSLLRAPFESLSALYWLWLLQTGEMFSKATETYLKIRSTVLRVVVGK